MPLFHRKKLSVSWQYTSPGVIWRLHPTGAGVIVGEERDLERKTASFFCCDQFHGELFWRSPSWGDPWWVGVETVHDGLLFVHGFASPDLPEHRGLIAVDVRTGQLLWENAQVKYLLAQGETVLAVGPGGDAGTVLELDIRSGTVLRTVGDDPFAVRRTRRRAELELQDEIELPVPLDMLLAEGSDVQAAVRTECGADLSGPVEAVDHQAWLVFQCRRRTAGGAPERTRITTVLSVMEKTSRQVAYTDTLLAGMEGLTQDGFFLHRDMLYYVKERRQLIAVRLSSPTFS